MQNHPKSSNSRSFWNFFEVLHANLPEFSGLLPFGSQVIFLRGPCLGSALPSVLLGLARLSLGPIGSFAARRAAHDGAAGLPLRSLPGCALANLPSRNSVRVRQALRARMAV